MTDTLIDLSFEDFFKEVFRREPTTITGEDGNQVYCGDADTAHRVWWKLKNAARSEISVPDTILGMTIPQIAELQNWFERSTGKTFPQFWEEAFNAGIQTSKLASDPDERLCPVCAKSFSTPKREAQPSEIPVMLSEAVHSAFSKRNAGEIMAYLDGILEGKYPMPSALIQPKRESSEDGWQEERRRLDAPNVKRELVNQRLYKAAKAYFMHAVQDEAAYAENCVGGEEQHRLACEFQNALSEIEGEKP